MASPYDFVSPFSSPQEEDPLDPFGYKKRSQGILQEPELEPSMPSTGPFNTGGMLAPSHDEIPPLEEDDPAAKMYLERAAAPMPSEGLIADYLSRRPDESGENKPKWYERLIAGVSMLGGRGSAQAGQEYLHRRYNRAYHDWDTEGKYIPQVGRSMDLGRSKELEAERFNLSGVAKKKSLEESKRKSDTAEARRVAGDTAKADKETAAEARRTASDARLEASAGRAEAAGSRAERSLSLSESRAARAEEDRKKGDVRQKNLDLIHQEERRSKAYEDEEGQIEESVTDEIVNNPQYSKYFKKDAKGNVDITDEGVKAGIHDLIKGEIEKKKSVARIRTGIDRGR